MAKTTNTKKVIEAEANLQTAKMLEGIQNLEASLNLFDRNLDVGWNNSAEKAIEKVFNPIINLKDVMLAVYRTKKECAINQNVKMVQDITKGIQLKAKYEMKINELTTALEVAKDNNNALEISLNELKSSFKELLDKIIEEKPSKEVIEAFMIKYSTDVMEKSIKFAVKKCVEKILKEKEIKCEAEQMPF